ncbi:MAG: calcium-binding protein [Cognatishimia sp.]
MLRWVRAIGVVAIWLCGSAAAMAEVRKVYVFGNSLIHHVSDTEATAVPHWLAYFAKTQGREFELDGQFGFLQNFANELPPEPQWGFKDVKSAWSRKFRTFEEVGYDTIMFNPANFVQYQPADHVYDGDNPAGLSPVSAAEKLMNSVSIGKRFVVYEGWSDLALITSRFPPRARHLRAYHTYNKGDYHEWYVDFAAKLSERSKETDVVLLPVAKILARAFTETELRNIAVTDLYVDDAPHGTPTLYFLAAAITYAGLFDELPRLGATPQGVDPLVVQHFSEFVDILQQELKISASHAAQNEKKTDKKLAASEKQQMPAQGRVLEPGVTPALAIGLDGISDWSTQLPFVNLMKSSRQWTGHLRGQWGGWGHQELQAGGYLDAHGWPKAIPKELDKIEAILLTDFPEAVTHLDAKYRLTYQGEGQVELSGSARAIGYGDKEIWFRFQPGEGSIAIAVHSSDPAGTGDHIRNITVVREDQIPLFEAGVVFNPEWISQIKDVRIIRFMDWMFTNGSPIQSWNARPQVNDYSYAWRGAPLEHMLLLANQIGADPWFNMPHLADDAYVQTFATQVRDGLRPGLIAHAEYSNEMWNFLFPQTHWAVQQAKERWGNAADDGAWIQFAGMRAAEVLEIWHSVFGPEASTRLKRVVATHTDWPGLEYGLLQAPLAVNEGKAQPVTQFDAYAVTGYFGHEMGTDDVAPKILDWIKKGKDRGQGYELAVQKSIAQLRRGSLKELLNDAWPYQADVARKNSLELMMYEGGTHVVGVENWPSNEDLTAFFNHLNYTPEMAELYQELLTAWTDLGGTAFNAFVDVAKPSQWGSWGALRHLQDKNPRHDVLMAYNAQGAMWNDTRKSSDFAHGVMTQGSAHADKLLGTVYADILLGDKGDDELLALGGDDYLHGGDGLDHAVLPGFIEEYSFFREGKRLRAQSIHGNIRMYGVETISFSTVPDFVLAVSDFF